MHPSPQLSFVSPRHGIVTVLSVELALQIIGDQPARVSQRQTLVLDELIHACPDSAEACPDAKKDKCAPTMRSRSKSSRSCLPIFPKRRVSSRPRRNSSGKLWRSCTQRYSGSSQTKKAYEHHDKNKDKKNVTTPTPTLRLRIPG